MSKTALLKNLYSAFNDRDTNRILECFAEDADWPNGMTGERVVGHKDIREYWTYQWTVINSKVEPLSFSESEGTTVVEVRQLVKDLNDNVISDGIVRHTYTFENDKVTRMDISL